jgi:hypothetical protein
VFAFILWAASVARGGDAVTHEVDIPLVKLALIRFHTLTRAERAMFEFAQAGNVERGQFAVAGSSSNQGDPSNDPKNAERWDRSREVRAGLIRWLCEDPDALHLVGPSGIALMGARVVGDLNLDAVQPHFGLTLVRCSIPGRVSMVNAHLQSLRMSDSCTGQIYAAGLRTDFFVFLDGVQSSGELVLDGANIGGFLVLRRAHFRRGPHQLPYMEALANWNLAVRVVYTEIHGAVDIIQGFEADGAVEIDNSTITGDLTLFGSRFLNPNSVAFAAESDIIGGEVMLGWPIDPSVPTRFDGQALFVDDQIAGGLFAQQVTFGGAPNTQHGLVLFDTSIKGITTLSGAKLANGAELNLTGSSTHLYADDREAWPAPGKLQIDGFTYDNLGGVTDARSRLRWLELQDGYHPQPYRQLAKVLRENGDEAGAIEVLVAQQDARYRNSNWLGRAWARLLKITVGYGHKPLRTVMWSLVVIVMGWLMVTLGARAGVMRATWPDSPPVSDAAAYEKLHPLLYSLDVFLPFVNLHQERYWWPNADAHGECVVMKRRIKLSGAVLRYYLWMQVIAGWLLSAIFVAGVTGLMRSE